MRKICIPLQTPFFVQYKSGVQGCILLYGHVFLMMWPILSSKGIYNSFVLVIMSAFRRVIRVFSTYGRLIYLKVLQK